jgi:hypothetical protein
MIEALGEQLITIDELRARMLLSTALDDDE